VAVDQRPPRHHVIDVGAAVDVGDRGAPGAGDEAGRAADRLEGAHRAVDAAGNHRLRAHEQRGGLAGGRGRHGPRLHGPGAAGRFRGLSLQGVGALRIRAASRA
jgi:hypothetical protein